MKHRFLYIMALLLTVATGAWAQDPDPIDLTPSADGTVWTLSTMPEYDVELEVTYYTDAELDQMAADEVIAKITAIGTVTYTPESKALIDAARTAYDALTAAQQALVTNYSTLTDAETTYAAAEETAYTEGVELTKNPDGTWTLAATPAFDVELEVEYETALALSETTDNSAALTEWDGYEADVTLTRILVAGSWNTFAVPFNVSSQMLGYLTSTYGMSVKQLASTTLENEGKTLMLTFTDAIEMVAGTPYLVKVTADFDFSAQALPDVVISKELHPVTTTYADFIPTLGKTTIDGVAADDVLFVAAGNTLKNPSTIPTDMKGFRAYFLLKNVPTEARGFALNIDGEATGIQKIEHGTLNIENSYDAVYDLQGRRMERSMFNVQRSMLKKGVYIQNGKKVIIK